MAKIQFPQINRRITASVGLIVILIYLGLNLYPEITISKTYEKNLQTALLKNPTNSFFHEKLGQYYLEKDNIQAEREYKLAQKYYQSQITFSNTNVLGSQSSPWQTWLNYIEKKQNLDREIQYWEKVSQIYPQYFYADLKLASLFWEKGEKEKAKSRLEKILLIDPANQTVSKILLKIK